MDRGTKYAIGFASACWGIWLSLKVWLFFWPPSRFGLFSFSLNALNAMAMIGVLFGFSVFTRESRLLRMLTGGLAILFTILLINIVVFNPIWPLSSQLMNIGFYSMMKRFLETAIKLVFGAFVVLMLMRAQFRLIGALLGMSVLIHEFGYYFSVSWSVAHLFVITTPLATVPLLIWALVRAKESERGMKEYTGKTNDWSRAGRDQSASRVS